MNYPKINCTGVYSSSGVRSTIVFTYLKSNGYENIKIVDGGYYESMEAILPVKLFKYLN